VSGDHDSVELLRQGLARGIVETYVVGMRSLGYSPDEMTAMAAEIARKETK
jgi:hypothetical protein